MDGLSIIIPVYNEEKIIAKNTEKLYSFLKNLGVKFEIIIVDNGSTDETTKKGKILHEKYSDSIKFFRINRKGAVGWAFRDAVIAARYDKIISADMDLSVDLSFIPKCLELLDYYNIVIGSKRVGSQRRHLYRRFASAIFIFMTRIFLGLGFSDYSMAAKGYKKKDIIEDVKKVDKGSSYVIELIYSAKKKGLNMKQIPVHCHDRRKSKFDFIDEVLYRFRSLLTFWFRERII